MNSIMNIIRVLLCICLTFHMSIASASHHCCDTTTIIANIFNVNNYSEDVKDTLHMFIDSNPYAVQVNILSDGTVAYLCADEENLFIRFSVRNPPLFMRMLMQGMTIYIDPTGRKKEKFALVFPSAADVQTSMENHQQQSTTIIGDGAQTRPDIIPLIAELNRVGAKYDINGNVKKLTNSRTMIELDTTNEILNYYALIPKHEMISEKRLSSEWTIGLFLDFPPSDFEGQKPPLNIIDERPAILPPSDPNTSELLRKKINAWGHFSIDEVQSINN